MPTPAAPPALSPRSTSWRLCHRCAEMRMGHTGSVVPAPVMRWAQSGEREGAGRYLVAITAISIFTSRGSRATSTVARAGGAVLKYSP